MWGTALAFVIKYWATFLLGIVASGISFFAKKYYTLAKAEYRRKEDARYEEMLKTSQKENQAMYSKISDAIQEIANKSAEGDRLLHERMDKADKNDTIFKNGLLSIQRKAFMSECRRLLNPEHVITLDEWDELTEDHDVYNSLGGNHKGDEYYELVRQKFTNNTILNHED